MARVGDIFDAWGGATPSTSEKAYWGGSIPWISSKDVKTWRITNGTDFVTKRAVAETRLRPCTPGTVLVVVRSGVLVHTLPVSIVEADVVINQDVKAFSCPERTLNEWLALFLRADAAQILAENRKDGTTVQSVGLDKLKALSFPVPPLTEQKRILAKVEGLLARSNAACERLARVPAILKRLRQAVLAAACKGGLTDANPEEWREATLEEVGEWFTGGTPSRRVASNFGGGIPWVKSGELRDGLVTETSETLSRTGITSSAAKLMPKGTVSVALYGATIGKVGVLGIEAATNQACANCVVNEKVIDRWFLFYFLTQQRDQLIEAGQGGAQPNLTNQIVRSWPLRLPPIPEQRKIVRRVVVLFKLADAIEKRVAVATARAEKLTQAILAKAFRGELVPTEAELARREGRTYETALALLERLSLGREHMDEASKRTLVDEGHPQHANGNRLRKEG